MNRSFYEVEVSNNVETVSALFEDMETAKMYADDCESITGVRLVVISGPYRVFTRESLHVAYARTWSMFSNLKGEGI